MFLFLSLLIAVSTIAIFIAGLLALLRNPKSPQNRWFFIFSILLSLWIPANFIDSNVVKPFWTDAFLRVDFGLALFIAWALMEFVSVFTTKKSAYKTDTRSKIIRYGTLALNIVFLLLASSGALVSAAINSGSLKVTYSNLFNVYAVILLVYFILALTNLFIKRRHASKDEKPALDLIFYGLMVAVVANLLTNLLFPLIINDRSIIKALNIIGYVGFLIFVILTYIAITTQKLFDIRLIVARSIAYVLSLGSMAAIFTVATIFISDVIFGNNLSVSQTRILYTLIAVVLALSLPYFKRYFDRITNKFFYRDSYDLKAEIDNFSGALVASIDLDIILDATNKLFNQTIRPQFTRFSIMSKNASIDLKDEKFTEELTKEETTLLNHFLNQQKKEVFMVDSLETNNQELYQLLSRKNIFVVVTLKTADELVGVILIGQKLTGSIYNSQDISFLTIVSKELALAAQNALRFREIQQFNITLQEKVDNATYKLRKANEKLKALDETKDEFISMASHQLRTPLTTVKGYVSMVLEGDAGKVSANQRKLLDQSYLSAQRMVYLIADLLNVSRLRTGKFVIDSTPTNLADLVEGEIEQLKETAKARHLELSYSKPKEFPVLMLDETKIRQVVMNFADNAIYYTPAGGHIHINLEDKADTIEFTVVDDGIGVPKTVQHHLFSKFYRADNAKKARPDGTGLGLFMAQKVVVAQGGAIIFRSEEGKGSTFGFSFSKAKLKVPDHLKADAKKAAEHTKEPSLL